MTKARPASIGGPPGQLSSLSEGWFRHRLGLLDRRGRVPAGAVAALAALDHYLAALLGTEPGREPGCWVSRMVAKGDDRGGWRWEWSGALRPGTGKDGARRHGRAMTTREVVAMLWRAALWLRIAPGGSPEQKDSTLLGSMLDGVWGGEDARRLLYTPAPGEQPVHRSRPDLLRLPRSELWIRAAPSYDHLGYAVVDLDWKVPADEPRFRALLRLLTGSPAIPRPHLIVTSRRGRGRHLYYLHDHEAGSALSDQGPVFGAEDAAMALKRGLVRVLGLGEWPGEDPAGLEVFPKDRKALCHMPYLPFGPGSHLCDERGEVVEREPLACLVAWHRRCVEMGMRRYTLRELAGASATGVEELAAEARGLLFPEAGAVTAVPEGETGTLNDADEEARGQQPASRGRRLSVRDAMRIYEDGPTPGEARQEILMLARYRKFHHGSGEDNAAGEDDQHWFAGWIRRHPRPDRTDDYAARFRASFRAARAELAGWSSTGLALRYGDARWAAALVVELLPDAAWATRSRLLRTWCYFLARARDLHPEAGGMGAGFDVHHEDLEKRGSKRHAAEVRLLIRSGRLELVRHHVRPNPGAGRPSGIVRAYAAELPPPDGDLVEVDEAIPDAVLAAALGTEDGRRLMGATNWRRLARRAQASPTRRSTA